MNVLLYEGEFVLIELYWFCGGHAENFDTDV